MVIWMRWKAKKDAIKEAPKGNTVYVDCTRVRVIVKVSAAGQPYAKRIQHVSGMRTYGGIKS